MRRWGWWSNGEIPARHARAALGTRYAGSALRGGARDTGIGRQRLYLSVASLWECAIKSSIGKLDVPEDFYRTVSGDYEILGIDVSHVQACANLPMHHRDPFDRMLVVQAQMGGLTLVTRDRNIAKYDVPVIAA